MKISIITVVYNAKNTILDTVESILSQQYQDIELIVIDGGSTDGTLELLESYKHRLILISESDSGIYDAMNKGLAQASGGVIGFLNGDDFYPTTSILERVSREFQNTDTEACYGDLLYIDAKNNNKITRYWRSGTFNAAKFYWGWMPPHPTFFVRQSIYKKYNGFNLDLGTAADYELMLRFLLKHKVKATYISEILVQMRTGGVSNVSFENRLKANEMDKKAWLVNAIKPHFFTLWLKPLRKVSQWFFTP